jgi:hypothetical protein
MLLLSASVANLTVSGQLKKINWGGIDLLVADHCDSHRCDSHRCDSEP